MKLPPFWIGLGIKMGDIVVAHISQDKEECKLSTKEKIPDHDIIILDMTMDKWQMVAYVQNWLADNGCVGVECIEIRKKIFANILKLLEALHPQFAGKDELKS